MKINVYGLLLIILSLSVISLTSCSDDSGSGLDASDCDSLTLPSDLTPVEINNQYFNNQNVPDDEEHLNYQQVKSIALTGNGLLSGGGSLGLITTYISTVQLLGVEPETSGGNCVWEFDASQFDPEADEAIIKVIGSESGNRTNWEIVASGDLGDEVVNDFKFLDGFTVDGGDSGEWSVFDPENPGTPALLYTWNIDSDQVYQLNLEIEQGDEVFVNYERDGADSNNMTFINDADEVSIFWNEENNSGWIEETGEPRRCYDDFVNAPC